MKAITEAYKKYEKEATTFVKNKNNINFWMQMTGRKKKQ